MNKFLLFSFIIIMFYTKGYTQQDSQYTQYMYNTVHINSGYTGSRGVLSILGQYRTQWVGLDGAPSTQTLSVHSPINERNKIGLGFSFINDVAGPSQETNFNASVSYTISFSDESKLSFGVNGGGNLLNVDIVNLRRYDVDDQLTLQNIDRRFSPSIGAGLYFRTNGFYLGVSIPNFLETEHFDESILSNDTIQSNVLAKERINYYLIAGYVFELTPLVKMKPALLTKYIEGSPLQIDLSANFLFYDRLTFGVSYRISNAISALAGFNISEGLMVGFSYDQELTELGKSSYTQGSYEFILRYELKKVFKRGVTPRFF